MEALIAVIVLAIIFAGAWASQRSDSQTEEKYKYTNRQGKKWVP